MGGFNSGGSCVFDYNIFYVNVLVCCTTLNSGYKAA
jgi:hypothetical protein